jgi:sec-independent protein translocase protein TatC
LFTDESLTAGNEVVPKDVKLPVDLNKGYEKLTDPNDKLIVTTALEPFAIYVKVSLYAAIGVSVPFILFQIWAFIAPGLYPHERKYVTPFITLSSVFFVLGSGDGLLRDLSAGREILARVGRRLSFVAEGGRLF